MSESTPQQVDMFKRPQVLTLHALPCCGCVVPGRRVTVEGVGRSTHEALPDGHRVLVGLDKTGERVAGLLLDAPCHDCQVDCRSGAWIVAGVC